MRISYGSKDAALSTGANHHLASVTEGLIRRGNSPTAIAAAIEVMQAGHPDILQKLVDRELTLDEARALARQRRGRR